MADHDLHSMRRKQKMDGKATGYTSAWPGTRATPDFFATQGRRKITLVDLERLVALWIEFYPKLDELARERLPLTPIYFLTPKT
jgi:hypothetical protein